MRGQRKLVWAGLSVLLFLAASCGGGGRPDGQSPTPKSKPGGKVEVIAGWNLELSGELAFWGKESRNGAELARDEINADPKSPVRLKMIFEDNNSTEAKSKDAVKKLILQDRVQIVLGSVASNKTLAAVDVAQEENIPLVTHASTNVAVTRKGDYIFRTCFNDDYQGRLGAEFALNDLKAKTAFLVVARGNAYSEGLVASFRRVFVARGGTVAGEEAYQSGETDFQTLITKIKAAQPDCIWLPGYVNEVALILKQAKTAGLAKPFVGADGWDGGAGTSIYSLGGPAVKDNYFVNHFDSGDTNPKVQEFVAKYAKKYGGKPGAMAALAYDLTYCVAEAAKRAGKSEPKALRDALAALSNLELVCGVHTMGPDREMTKPAVVLKTGQNEHIFLKRL